MTDASLPHFQIHLTPGGGSRVLMDGLDLSEKVASVTISKPGKFETPAVILEIPGKVDLTADAAVFMDGNFWETLESLNPAELDDEATQRQAYGQPLAAVLLDIIKERLRGSSS